MVILTDWLAVHIYTQVPTTVYNMTITPMCSHFGKKEILFDYCFVGKVEDYNNQMWILGPTLGPRIGTVVEKHSNVDSRGEENGSAIKQSFMKL